MLTRKIIVAVVCYFCHSIQVSYANTDITKHVISPDYCQSSELLLSLVCGEFSGRLKTLYYSTHNAYFADNLNQDTIAIGGFFKYQTRPFLGMGLGLSYAGQWRLDDKNTDHPEVTELKEQKDGLAEAYLNWQHEKFNMRFGQQNLDIPFVGNYDWRIMPVLYRALDVQYKNDQSFIRLTAIDRFKSYADDQFTKTSRYSQNIKTDGMWSIGLGKSYDLKQKDMKAEVWYQSYDNYNEIWYTEAHLKFKDYLYQPDIAMQIMWSQDQGEAYAGKTDHFGIGLNLGLSVLNNMTLNTSYNYIDEKQDSYLNGALFTPYMIDTASGPYFAQPFFTSTQDLGAGQAFAIALEGNLNEQTYVGVRYSLMDLKERNDLKSLNQSEYILYGIYNFKGAFKGWSLSNFAGVQTSPREKKTFLQNRFGLSYQF